MYYFYSTRFLEMGLNNDWIVTDTYKRLSNQRAALLSEFAQRAGLSTIWVDKKNEQVQLNVQSC